ncbi:uncharacterized protein RCH25_016229 [Pelodytes ibericus]
MFLYQPQETLFLGVNSTAEISCKSKDIWLGNNFYCWYYRRIEETPTLIINCRDKSTHHKYSSSSVDGSTNNLQIRNVQRNDSGIYYCLFNLYPEAPIGSSTSNSSVHVLAPSQTLLSNTPVQLTCVVRAAPHVVHVMWNISGVHHKGRMVTMVEPGGTWTFLNHISIPRDTWDSGETLSCDVWLHSSSIRVHRKPAEVLGSFFSACSFFLQTAVTGIILLIMVLSVHLAHTYIP